MNFAKPFVIAEISGEHRGLFTNALALINAAKDAGADAAKLQCFDPERLAERRGGRNKVATGLWAGRTLIDLYRETHTPREWFPELFAYGKEIGIHVFSSVFDVEDVAYLETIGCPAYKISAMEAQDGGLVMAAEQTGKPVIVSINGSGGVSATMGSGAAYLHCVSSYPCREEDVRLDAIDELRRRLPYWPIGFSDHTPGITAAVDAVKHYNAQLVEKHITLSRTNGGPDAAFSLEPAEFKQMVDAIHA